MGGRNDVVPFVIGGDDYHSFSHGDSLESAERFVSVIASRRSRSSTPASANITRKWERSSWYMESCSSPILVASISSRYSTSSDMGRRSPSRVPSAQFSARNGLGQQ